jgi:hypothetical protein
MTSTARILAISFLVLLPLCARADDGAALVQKDVQGDAPPLGMAGFLFSHNRVREEHCAPPLVWSAEVARRAQRWADSLAANGCPLKHSGGYGENLVRGTVGVDEDPEKIVDLWYREVNAYDFTQGDFSPDTGHFTQVVWNGSRRLGCATSTCRGTRIWVCHYDPPGNYIGEFATNVRRLPCRTEAPAPHRTTARQLPEETVVVEDVTVIDLSGKGQRK